LMTASTSRHLASPLPMMPSAHDAKPPGDPSHARAQCAGDPQGRLDSAPPTPRCPLVRPVRLLRQGHRSAAGARRDDAVLGPARSQAGAGVPGDHPGPPPHRGSLGRRANLAAPPALLRHRLLQRDLDRPAPCASLPLHPPVDIVGHDDDPIRLLDETGTTSLAPSAVPKWIHHRGLATYTISHYSRLEE
jgi:hypothetical protein